MTVYQQLKVDQVGEVTVVRFRESNISAFSAVEKLAEELYQLVEVENRKKLLLNFASVGFLSSSALGKFISLNGKLKARSGAVKLCNLQPQVLDVFLICKLDRLFDIRTDEAEALRCF
jgi:anti-sigma B factor antagonist